MKVCIFSCSAQPATKAVSLLPQGANLPDKPCIRGEWLPSGHLELAGVEAGVTVPGINMQALHSGLDRQGWHIFTGAGDSSAFDISYV